MSTKWEKVGTNNGTLTFSVSNEAIQEGLKTVYSRVQKDLSVPGFRKGKVPRQIFNKMYGEESLYEDALNAVLPAAYQAAVEEAGIDPVSQPEISVESMEKGQPWEIKAEVIVKPEVKLGDYKGLSVPKQDREVTDADVEASITQKQAELAELVIKEAAAESGDTVVIDFEGFKDDVAFEGGQADNHSLELGSNSFIPGFEDQLVGTKAGDKVDVALAFPEEYQVEDLAGQDVVFKVTVHEVKAKELPELDDDFAKDVDDEVETLDALKAKIKEELVAAKIAAAEEAIEEAVIAKAVENAEIVEIPGEMVHDEVHRGMNEFLSNMQNQGITPELYYQMTGTTEQDLHVQFEGDAESRVRTNLVIEAIVAAENYEVTAEDIEAEIASLAEQYNMEVSAVRNALTDDMLAHDIKMKQAVEVITGTVVEEA